MNRNLKKTLKKILSHPLIGRPLRKFLHITQFMTRQMAEISATIHQWVAITYSRQPYIHALRGTLNSEPHQDVFEKYLIALRHAVDRMPYQPKISVLVPVYKVEPRYFEEALLSVGYQAWTNWEVCLVDDASGMPELRDIWENFAKAHPGKVKVKVHDKNRHISHASNSCLELADGDYIALLDHDDRLAPHALAEMVRYINLYEQPDILYSDERHIDGDGRHVHTPYFKPDFSPEMHLAVNYTTHLTLYRREVVKSVGGFRPGFEGSQDHDLMLRLCEVTKKKVVHVPFCLYQWRAHEASTAASSDSKPYAAAAGERAVKEALERRRRKGKVQWEQSTLHYRVTYDPPPSNPLISIIIPSKDSFEVIRTCLTSVFTKSTWQNFEIVLVDNGTVDPKCLQLFAEYADKYGDRFKHLPAPGPFNFARLINQGVVASKGDYLLFLNNDTEVLTPNWLEEMLGLAQWPEIGAVGAKLLYPDGSLQHAGIITTGPYIAGHSLARQPAKTQRYWSYSQTIHEASGVTAACLMIEKSKFLKAGSLDELWIPNGFGDVEFCLRLKRHGYSCIYTPYAVLTHYESKTRKSSIEYFEHFWIRAKYPGELLNDPYLNPSLLPDGLYTLNPWYTGTDFNEPDFHRFVKKSTLWTFPAKEHRT